MHKMIAVGDIPLSTQMSFFHAFAHSSVEFSLQSMHHLAIVSAFNLYFLSDELSVDELKRVRPQLLDLCERMFEELKTIGNSCHLKKESEN